MTLVCRGPGEIPVLPYLGAGTLIAVPTRPISDRDLHGNVSNNVPCLRNIEVT